VQLVVLQRLCEWGMVDVPAVREQYEIGDERDLLRALQILLARG
jgi:hypothetical protein